MKRPVITLLTDFGSQDHYTGVMKGVLLGICPEAQLVDITHEIAPWAIAEGAYTLSQAWKYFPEGTVHLVVVDPGVGSSRRGVVVEAAGHRFVAPDNGVLTMLYDAVPDASVHEITASRYFRQPVSRTFHGRDIFSPIAAHLAAGMPAAEAGPEIDDPVRLDFAKPAQTGPVAWSGTILKVDRFGNVITNFAAQDWTRLVRQPFELKAGKCVISRMASNYAEAGHDLFLIEGSAGFLEISRNRASAAEAAGVRSGDSLEMRLR